MKHTLKKLFEILQPFIDAEEGETGDYPELDEMLRDIIAFAQNQDKELRTMWSISTVPASKLVKEFLGEG